MITSAAMQHVLTSIRRLLETTWPSFVVAVVTWVSIVVAIDPAGSYPNMPEGPGLAVDEIFNVEQGVLLVEQAKALGWLNLVPGTSVEAFKLENHYLPDHPPLGRYWLGVHHHLTWWLFPPFDPEGPCVTACARTGSATAFALTVWMIGLFATTHFGRAAGLFASLALVLMPRLYGHAHIASLETITNLTCTAAVLAIAHWWNGSAPPSRRVALLTGVVMGLALLTKIQAILIPIPVILWALWRWRAKAIVPLLIWGVTANVVFFALWPYLWLDPVGHYLEYLGRTTNRATIHCFYFGVRYDDKAVPWHYPFVMFAVTVPLGLHLLGAWGASSLFGRQPLFLFFRSGGRESPGFASESTVVPSSKAPLTLTLSPQSRGEGTRHTDILLLACTLFPLIVFALPRVAVYDGERLFLTSFPLWAVYVGIGLSDVWTRTFRRGVRWILRGLLIGVLVWSLAIPWGLRPFHLSYYNALVGGQTGAEQLGLEFDYWGTGITRSLLWEVIGPSGRGTLIAIGPTLHQFQAEEYHRQSPLLRQYGIKTLAVEAAGDRRILALLYRRRSDLPRSRDNVRYDPNAGDFKNPKIPPIWWDKFVMEPTVIYVQENYADESSRDPNKP